MKRFLLGALVGAGGVLATEGRLTVGGAVWNAETLKRYQSDGKRISTIVIGGVVISDDVDPELATSVIDSLRVVGGLVGPQAVLKALSGRIMVLGGVNRK